MAEEDQQYADFLGQISNLITGATPDYMIDNGNFLQFTEPDYSADVIEYDREGKLNQDETFVKRLSFFLSKI